MASKAAAVTTAQLSVKITDLQDKVQKLSLSNTELKRDLVEIGSAVIAFVKAEGLPSKFSIFWAVGKAKAIYNLIAQIIKILTTKGHVSL